MPQDSSRRDQQVQFVNGMIMTSSQASAGGIGVYSPSTGEVMTITSGGLVLRYNNILLANFGFASILKTYFSTGLAALVANAVSYTPAAVASTMRVSVYVNVRTAAAVNMNVTVAYTDAAGVARSELLALNQQNTATVAVNMNNTAGRFTGSYIFMIDASGTAITISTTGTTQTLYDLNVVLEQLA